MPSITALEEIWGQATAILSQFRTAAVSGAVKYMQPLSYIENKLVIGVQSDVSREFLKKKVADKLSLDLTVANGTSIVVDFVVQQQQLPLDINQLPEKPALKPRKNEHISFLPLNDKYTFDNFVVGVNNKFAHAAGERVAKFPGKSYNPLFIYGGVGLGKTHLMQAIGHAAKHANRNLRVNYVSGDDFTHHMVNSITQNRYDSFRDAYRDVDIWLVDDIQFIAAKERTEAEFFQVFNTLLETGRQVVISSDRPPKDLQIMDQRLLSRFEYGIMTDIKMPDLETRMAILQKKENVEGMRIPTEVISYIATTISANIRVLEGALIKVAGYCSITGEEPTVSMAMELLRDHSTTAAAKTIGIAEIQNMVINHFKISIDELVGTSRIQDLVLARQVAMYLCRNLLNSSFPEIARKFGGRDHTTVMYACTKLEKSMRIDKEMKSIISDLTTQAQEVIKKA